VTHRFLGALEAKQVTEVTGVQVAFRIGNANSLTHMGRVASGNGLPEETFILSHCSLARPHEMQIRPC
jgi:hypothetical protein